MSRRADAMRRHADRYIEDARLAIGVARHSRMVGYRNTHGLLNAADFRMCAMRLRAKADRAEAAEHITS